MGNRENNVKELQDKFIELKNNFDTQAKVLKNENYELKQEVREASTKNSKLITALQESQGSLDLEKKQLDFVLIEKLED